MCRWPLRPEQVALALAEQPSAQPLVSEDILSPLASPASGLAPSMRSRADVGAPPGARQRPAADVSNSAARALRSPPAAASPMQFARASIQQWGKPRGSLSPASEKMVICGPTWSFPVEAASPSNSSSKQATAELRPAHLASTASPAAPHRSFRSSVDQQRSEAGMGMMRMPDLAVHPEERSISFRLLSPECRGKSHATACQPCRGISSIYMKLLPMSTLWEPAWHCMRRHSTCPLSKKNTL